jgi:hypothetical protein
MAAKLPRARVLPFLMVLVLAIAGAVAWRMRPPWQRPSTLPDGATIAFEHTTEDGAYSLGLRVSGPAFVRWVETLGMHEVAGDDPDVREWDGPDVDGCFSGAVLDHGVAAWGMACPREPRFDPGRPYGVHGVLHVR